MNTGNLIFQAFLLSLALMAFQRTERKRKWLVGVFFTAPAIILLWRVSIFNQQLTEFWVATGIAALLNGLFWFFYGRQHPPGHKGEITVFGQED